MIVIGVDTHKRSHTLVALDAVTGAMRGQLTIPASDEGTLDALRFAAVLDAEPVWAFEDCRHVSGRLERGLVASGDRVVRVAPGLTETSRRAVREPGKSDPIDATAIARAALREAIDRLPVAFLDERALEIRVLNDYRDQHINERVRLASRCAPRVPTTRDNASRGGRTAKLAARSVAIRWQIGSRPDDNPARGGQRTTPAGPRL
jgi:transposase